MEIDVLCPHCGARETAHLDQGAESIPCSHCQRNLVEFLTPETREGRELRQCPVCGAAHTYRQKDFNRALGVGLIVVGVALAYFTYGISLVLVTLIDWLLVRRVGEVGCCYQCHAQFRKSPMVSQMEAFNLSLHDYYKNLKKES